MFDSNTLSVFKVCFVSLIGVNCQSGVSAENPQLHPRTLGSGEESSRGNILLWEDSLFSLPDNRTKSLCSLNPVDDSTYTTILTLLSGNAKLLEYRLRVVNHTVNPLLVDATWTYRLDQWARVSHNHGQTILSLAFNYGVLSLMTLSFGVASVDVDLVEQPRGCLDGLEEHKKAELLLDLLLRDFRPGGRMVIHEGAVVCHQVIKNSNGYAKFTDRCCKMDTEADKVHCITDYPNVWLHLLERLMACVSLVVVLFGPLASPKFFSGAGLEVVRYVVKLKEPLYKTMCLVPPDKGSELGITYEHVIDLQNEKGFNYCKSMARKMPCNKVIPIKISEYQIYVSYEKLLPENSVPVGFWACLIRAIFMCKMQSVDAFQDCCDANLCGCFKESKPMPWISICRVFGRILMVLFLPFPFYIRLIMYFMFEEPEVLARQQAAANTGLPICFEYRLLQYLTPTHPLFIAAYCIYYTAGFTLAYFSTTEGKSRFQQVIIDSFRDLNDLSWLKAIGMIVKNFLWPFKKLGIFGLIFGVLYWPLVMPISLLAATFNCLPLVFLTYRMLFHALRISTREKVALEQVLPGQLQDDATGIQMFETDNLLTFVSSPGKLSSATKYLKRCEVCKTVCDLILAVISILTFYAIMLMVTECASCVLHICVFTMMGIIVNAGKVLKYGALIFMVILYSYDCYNNVYLQYLKLNKALFSEIKSRIKDISEVTMLPSYLQENRGFKSQENSDQADHESADDLSEDKEKHWVINDLILFIDNNDVPRIPKRLFEQVCDIEVPGSPGPVYRSLIMATGKFLLIILFLIFVFIVVLSFGDVYKISSTNQMLATMAGGFMPFIFSNLLKPAQPAIELGSVSFKSKLEEIVINFWQMWPMSEFTFEIGEEPEELDEEGSGDDRSQKSKDAKSDKKAGNGLTKKMSMAEILEKADTTCTEEIMTRLLESKTYRQANGQYIDIIMKVDGDTHWSDDCSKGSGRNSLDKQGYETMELIHTNFIV